jgi:hypothetical protein
MVTAPVKALDAKQRRRLRQHLTGNRDSSVLHDQVGHLLDTPDHAASAGEIAEWRSVRQNESP